MAEPWQKVLMAAGGAAAVGSLLYCLCSDGPETEAAEGQMPPAGSATDQALQILEEMVTAQEGVRESMKVLSKQLSDEPQLTFDQIYAKVRASEPADPLESRGMSPQDLEGLLQGCHTDPLVHQALQALTAPSSMGGGPSARAKEMTVEEIVEIHAFMLEELQTFAAQFRGLDDRGAYSTKTVIIASQVVLESRRSAKFGVTSEEVDAAVMEKHASLATSEKFMTIHMKMQQAMVSLGDGI